MLRIGHAFNLFPILPLPFFSAAELVLLFFVITKIHRCMCASRSKNRSLHLTARMTVFMLVCRCNCCKIHSFEATEKNFFLPFSFVTFTFSYLHLSGFAPQKLLQHFNEICCYYWPILLPTNWIWPFSVWILCDFYMDTSVFDACPIENGARAHSCKIQRKTRALKSDNNENVIGN